MKRLIVQFVCDTCETTRNCKPDTDLEKPRGWIKVFPSKHYCSQHCYDVARDILVKKYLGDKTLRAPKQA